MSNNFLIKDNKCLVQANSNYAKFETEIELAEKDGVFMNEYHPFGEKVDFYILSTRLGTGTDASGDTIEYNKSNIIKIGNGIYELVPTVQTYTERTAQGGLRTYKAITTYQYLIGGTAHPAGTKLYLKCLCFKEW